MNINLVSLALALMLTCASASNAMEFRVLRLTDPTLPSLEGRFDVAPLCSGFAILRSDLPGEEGLYAYQFSEAKSPHIPLELDVLKDFQIQHIASGGNVLCISAWKIHGDQSDPAKERCVFVFRMNAAGGCDLEATLYPPNYSEPAGYYSFGERIVIDGDRLMLVELKEDSKLGEETLELQFYEKIEGGWAHKSTTKVKNTRSNQIPGLDWNNDILAIQDGIGLNVYERKDDGEWKQVSQLRPPLKYACTGSESLFGEINDVGDNAIIVGAPSHDFGRGAAYLFKKGDDGAWTFADAITLGELDAAANPKCKEFGRQCALIDGGVAIKAMTGTYTSVPFLWKPDAPSGMRLTQVEMPVRQAENPVELHAAVVGDLAWSFFDSRYVSDPDPERDPAAASLKKFADQVLQSDDPENVPPPKDPWGKEVEIQVGTTEWAEKKWTAVEVKSAGPDGEVDTWDDLTIDVSDWTTPVLTHEEFAQSPLCGEWTAPTMHYKISLAANGSCTMLPDDGQEAYVGEWVAVDYGGQAMAICRLEPEITVSGLVAFRLLKSDSQGVRVQDGSWPIEEPVSFCKRVTMSLTNDPEPGIPWVKAVD